MMMRKYLTAAAAVLFILTSAGAELPVEKVNAILGIPIFPARNNWLYSDFRKRTKLRLSGNGDRYYCFYRKNIAGAQAREIHIKTGGSPSRITLISITFATRGDDRLAAAKVTGSSRIISKNLNSLFGKSRRMTPDFSPVRIKMDTWKYRDAEIFLEVDKGEFTMLHIRIPLQKQPEKSAKKRNFSENLEKNDFGDVYIKNIPMVDQGGKGYCAPATFSRVFLYYGINLDMHHLAKRGDSDPENGTSISEITRSIRSIRKKSGLEMVKFSDISINDINGHIDRGHPVFWLMFSTGELEELYDFSRKNRRLAKTPESWKRTLKKVSVPHRTTRSHICLIIGYNKETDEIAVSNSWGKAHIAPVWIPVKAAKKVSQNMLFVLRP